MHQLVRMAQPPRKAATPSHSERLTPYATARRVWKNAHFSLTFFGLAILIQQFLRRLAASFDDIDSIRRFAEPPAGTLDFRLDL